MGHVLDLDAYLRRIGFFQSVEPTLPIPRGLAAAHASAIAFENLNPLLGLQVV